MSSPELIKDLLVAVEYLKKGMNGYDAERAKADREAYRELLDRFDEEYRDRVAPRQYEAAYEAAKDDPDYFLVLIKLARHHEEHEKVDKQGMQLVPYFNWKLFTQI